MSAGAFIGLWLILMNNRPPARKRIRPRKPKPPLNRNDLRKVLKLGPELEGFDDLACYRKDLT